MLKLFTRTDPNYITDAIFANQMIDLNQFSVIWERQ